MVLYRCSRAPAGRTRPNPQLSRARACAGGFQRIGSIRRRWYACRRILFITCRTLFWQSDLSRIYPKPGNAFIWTFQYRCHKAPD